MPREFVEKDIEGEGSDGKTYSVLVRHSWPVYEMMGEMKRTQGGDTIELYLEGNLNEPGQHLGNGQIDFKSRGSLVVTVLESEIITW